MATTKRKFLANANEDEQLAAIFKKMADHAKSCEERRQFLEMQVKNNLRETAKERLEMFVELATRLKEMGRLHEGYDVMDDRRNESLNIENDNEVHLVTHDCERGSKIDFAKLIREILND